MSEYETIDEIESATLTTLVPYANEPEIRQYDIETIEELLEKVQTIDKPNIGERVIHVEVEHI